MWIWTRTNIKKRHGGVDSILLEILRRYHPGDLLPAQGLSQVWYRVVPRTRATTTRPTTVRTVYTYLDPLEVRPKVAQRAGVHVHVHQRANSPLSSPSHTHVTPDRSQNSLYNPLPTPPTSDSDLSPRPGITGDEEQTRTRSHSYELLLLQCGLGFPLWMPSPRCTPDGEYELDIGDVGVLSHGLPFNTLFNITQSPTSPANKDGIPEGVDPPCPLASRWFTIKKGYHPPETVLIRPARAISKQEAHAGAGFNVFNFRLSAEGGALLMLPQGGTLKKLEKTASFKERLRFHWRQWYDFAQGQVDLDDGQALYLVTSVESNLRLQESLELTVDGTTGACSWAFPPVRCSTQSSDPLATANNPQSGPRETVFVRGFRIDRFDGSINQRPPGFSLQPGKGKDDNSDGHSNSRGGSSRDLSSFGDSSNSTFPTRYSCSGGGSSGASNPQSDSPDPLIDTTQIMELDPNRSDNEGVSVTHPCEVINKFAFELMSHMKPALDTGCVAFSHDDDWISILQDSDKGIPLETEIIRRICSQFKFAIGGNTTFTVSMTNLDKELLENARPLHFKASATQSQYSWSFGRKITWQTTFPLSFVVTSRTMPFTQDLQICLIRRRNLLRSRLGAELYLQWGGAHHNTSAKYQAAPRKVSLKSIIFNITYAHTWE
ncbi:hypothetical protein PM082_015732 [Marasmius tenuissimus]|nr:hypothetical protein PM082_015732 [Marasmius tenuissimus]